MALLASLLALFAIAAPPQPVGPPGPWTLAFNDEFTGTAINTAKWDANWYHDGATQNNVPTYARNARVYNGQLWLRLANENGKITGASVNTQGNKGFQVKPGMYAEARVLFAGSSTCDIYNWPAWWISGVPWPSAGEHDIAEGLGCKLTVNYHSPTGAYNQGTPTGGPWGNAFHTFGVHRKAASADVYWDGRLVRTYPTSDNGGGENLIFNVGKSGTAHTGWLNGIRVDWVRVWTPG